MKALVSGASEPRRFPSGKSLTPRVFVDRVNELVSDWTFDAIAIGFPAKIGDHGPCAEPGNLGSGWVGFNFARAFGKPVRVINDAAMQALGSYAGGRMLFLGLGTGLGSSLVTERTIVSMELGRLRFGGRQMLGQRIGKAGLKRLGRKAWLPVVKRAIRELAAACLADYVVLGGGNAELVKPLPPRTRRGDNDNAFVGGFRLWDVEGPATKHPRSGAKHKAPLPWRSI